MTPDRAVSDHPRRRRHRIHRWTPGAPAARRGPRGAVPHAATGEARRRGLGGTRRGGAGRRPRRREPDAARWRASTSSTTSCTRSAPAAASRRRTAPPPRTSRRGRGPGGRAADRVPRGAACRTGEAASPHLASRAEVGQILLDGPVPAVVLQAGVIIGSGSASFEMLRYLTERLPVMVTPKWVRSRVQPIAVRDVLSYLVGALDAAPGTNRRFDIAGPDVLTYEEMMQRYAAVAGPAAADRHRGAGAHPVAVEPVGERGHAGPEGDRAATDRVAAQLGRRPRARHRGPDPDPAARLRRRGREGAARRSSTSTWRPAGRERSGRARRAIRCRPTPTGPGQRVPRRARGHGRRAAPETCGGWSRGSAATAAGTRSRSRGRPAGSSTASSAASACVAAAGTPTCSRSVSRSTSGGSRRSSAGACSASGPRCGCRARRGSSSASTTTAAARVCASARLFIPHGLSGHLYWWSVWPFHGVVFGSMLHSRRGRGVARVMDDADARARLDAARGRVGSRP